MLPSIHSIYLSLKAAITHGISYVPRAYMPVPWLEGLKTVSVVVQVLTVGAATHPQPVLRGTCVHYLCG